MRRFPNMLMPRAGERDTASRRESLGGSPATTAQGGMQHGSMDEKWIAGIVRATLVSVMVLALSGV